MQVIEHPDDIVRVTSFERCDQKQIGLVPTMGALHKGHQHLVQKALDENDVVVVSIFVNPLQFNNSDDLKGYPRTLKEDLVLLESMDVDYVFTPSEAVMYPQKPQVTLNFGRLAEIMEGEFRPGHFAGVGLVVSKLLHLINPTRAYFGLKDLQQYLIIKKLSEDLSFLTEVKGIDIVREASGLAMSSRNKHLSLKGRVIASQIHQGLQLGKHLWLSGKGADETKREVNAFYKSQEGIRLEYLHLVDPVMLEKMEADDDSPAVLCVAGYVEGVRLIDNLYLH